MGLLTDSLDLGYISHRLNLFRVFWSVLKMLKKLRQSKFALLSLCVALVAVVFCQHCEHEATHTDEVVQVEVADTCCEVVLCSDEPAEQHDHGDCEFDALHGHDFPSSVSKTFVPLVRVAEVRVFSDDIFPAKYSQAQRSTLPQITGSPLQTLNCVRLLI